MYVIVGLELLMAIPVPLSLAHGVCTIEELNETHAPFDQASGQKAVAGESRLEHIAVIRAV